MRQQKKLPFSDSKFQANLPIVVLTKYIIQEKMAMKAKLLFPLFKHRKTLIVLITLVILAIVV